MDLSYFRNIVPGFGKVYCLFGYGSRQFFGVMEFDPESPYIKAYFHILKNGSLMDVFRDNITNGLLTKIEFQFGTFERGYLTLGFFLIGMWFGRIRLFERLNELKPVIKNIMWYSLGFGFVCILLVVVQFSQIPQPPDFSHWKTMFAMHTMDLANIGLTGFILAGFLVIYASKKRNRLNVLAPYGRTALTNYVMQSLIGTFIFYGWGLGFIAELQNSYTFLIAILVLIIQLLISIWWMKKFYYGPFEWIWRCLTWWKIMPMVRR